MSDDSRQSRAVFAPSQVFTFAAGETQIACTCSDPCMNMPVVGYTQCVDCPTEARCSNFALAQLLVIGQLLAQQDTNDPLRDLPVPTHTTLGHLALPDPRSPETVVSNFDEGHRIRSASPASALQQRVLDAEKAVFTVKRYTAAASTTDFVTLQDVDDAANHQSVVERC